MKKFALDVLKLVLMAAILATSILSLQACAGLKKAVLTADDVAAQLLCAQNTSELKGITVDEARDSYCSTRETWRPWLDAVLRARRAGAAMAAGKPDPEAVPECPPAAALSLPPAPAPAVPKSSPAGSTGAP